MAPPGETAEQPRWLKARVLVGAAVTLAFVVLALFLLVRVHEVLFLVFVAAVLATALDVPVSRLSRGGRGRGPATIVVLVAVLVLAAVTIAIAAPLVVAQGNDLAQALPHAVRRLGELWEEWVGNAPGTTTGGGGGGGGNSLLETATQWASRATAFLGSVATGFGALIAVVFMAAFFTYQPRVYLDGAIRLVPPARRDAAVEFLRRAHPVLQGWMLGTLVSMLTMGTLAAIGLRVLGVRAWFFLGVLTFATEFIPYLGPVIAGGVAALFGLADSPWMAVKVVVLFFVLHEVEGHTLVPVLMKRAVRLQPALLIAWQLSMAAAFGFYGLLVATPLLAVLKVAVEYFYLERTLGERA